MPSTEVSQSYATREFYIGLALAVSSSIFIGSSFIIKKKALIKLGKSGHIRASAGGFGYLREWLWWAGILTMGVGEVANFVAYAFAPASLVTPLGALSVLVTTVLAAKFLNERLNLLGKLGCFLCILGSTMIIIHSPRSEEVEDLSVLLEKIQEPAFVVYVSIVVMVSLIIACYVGPRYGHRHVAVYITLCSAVGSLTVMACKGLGLAIKETLSGYRNETGNWLTWLFLVAVIVCIMIQMDYLNKALDIFNTGIVTPVYYVMFTTLVIIASALLFKEWQNLGSDDIIGNLCGFLVIIVAIVLLNTFKDMDVDVSSLGESWPNKRDPRGSFKAMIRIWPEKEAGFDSKAVSTYGTPTA